MKKFVMSYSFGKDSTLCLDRMISQGHKPVALLVMVNTTAHRSYFHGVDFEMMEKVSASLGIPLLMGLSVGEDYNSVMVQKLLEAKELGAEVAVFGDIDIEDHFKWCSTQCKEANIAYEFPLWQEDRAEVVEEILKKGYTCIIKAIDSKKLPKSVLGKALDTEMLEIFKENNVDLCGENGEYHTVVVDGPIFKNKVDFVVKNVLELENATVADLILE